MIGVVRDWLPAEITTRPDILAHLEAVLSNWSARWFARPFLKITGSTSFRGHARQFGSGSEWRALGGGVAVSLSRQCATLIVGAAMDIDLEKAPTTPTDQRVISAFEAKLLVDLADELERGLALPDRQDRSIRLVTDPFNGHGGVVLSLSGEGLRGATASLAIPLDVVAKFCRSLVEPSEGPKDALVRRDHAMGADKVAVHMTLGSAAVSFGSLKDLSVGDVIVLDAPISQAATITMSVYDEIIGQGTLLQDDNGVSVVVQA